MISSMGIGSGPFSIPVVIVAGQRGGYPPTLVSDHYTVVSRDANGHCVVFRDQGTKYMGL